MCRGSLVGKHDPRPSLKTLHRGSYINDVTFLYSVYVRYVQLLLNYDLSPFFSECDVIKTCPLITLFRRNCSDPVSRLIDIFFVFVVVVVVVVVAVVVFVLYLKMFHMSKQKVEEQLLMRDTLIVFIHEW